MRDLDARVANVKSFVDEINRALSQVRTATTYNVEAGTGAPLVGSSAARAIGTRLTSAMGTVVPGGSMVLLGQIGITLGADGTYQLDEAKLSSALESDPEGVAAAARRLARRRRRTVSSTGSTPSSTI